MFGARRFPGVRWLVTLFLALSALAWPAAYDLSTAQTILGAQQVDVLIGFDSAPRRWWCSRVGEPTVI